MYRIEFDFKKETIFVPKETADAIGSPTEVSFLYRDADATLLLVNGVPSADPPRKRRGRPADPAKTSFMKSWDAEANGFRIKGYLPTLCRLGWKFPGCESSIIRGVYILEGDLCMENGIRFDLTQARLDAPQASDAPAIDLSGYQVVERSAFRRRSSQTNQ